MAVPAVDALAAGDRVSMTTNLGISAELKARIVAFFEAMARFQSEAGLPLGDDATIRGGSELTVTARFVDSRLTLIVSGPKPRIEARKAFVSLRGELQGAQVDKDRAVIVIDGLPDVTIELT